MRRLACQLAAAARIEQGIALPLACGILAVLGIAATSAVAFSGTNARSSDYAVADQAAVQLAEAGLNEAISVLADPANNALHRDLLPLPQQPHRSTYANGSTTWSGTLDEEELRWTIRATGEVANPTGPSLAPARHTMTARVPVHPVFAEQANTFAWNYIVSTRTGQTCDMAIEQSVEVASPLSVQGNLCLRNTARIVRGPLIVGGSLALEQSANSVGSATARISAAHIGGACRYRHQPWSLPCQGPPDNVFAEELTSSAEPIQAPEVEWDRWYANASPGPMSPCGVVAGTPPAFDVGDGVRNNSFGAAPRHLTPGASYTCKTTGGELSWNATTRLLTVRGTVFIDGSAKIENGQVNVQEGQATLYLSGTLLVKNSRLCAVVSGSTCTSTGWNPNERLLIVVAGGQGGQVPAGVGIQLVSAWFQGGLFAINAITVDTTSQAIGPMLGSTVYLGQSTQTSFPMVTILPVGAPGLPPTLLARLGRPEIG